MASCGDIEDGFGRAEMFSEPLAGTIDKYDGHIFVCVPAKYTEWPPDAGSIGLVKALSGRVKAASKVEGAPVYKVTVCEATEGQDGNIILFPPKGSHIKGPTIFRGAANTEADVDWFMSCIVGSSISNPERVAAVDPATVWIFVCCHASRDRRCGKCGPELLDLSRELTKDRPVTSLACSHVGGHVYAGNVIVYKAGEMDWFGYVTPAGLASILSSALGLPEADFAAAA
eukprot:CAMPEP_0113694756 /NCGR_PEP_ID=MMETSP0038_2-20120614/20487_1 /TAXON_ID=2898 /ORGANISM="Cryptomonas paramecium" /LENGTH=228 /DNA_ID=CAMNT_0000617155 /DNA_START=87 /DNA_END=769 /DNA_ORIENTATION=+ /assembly_acc=CAM_ASM_000170